MDDNISLDSKIKEIENNLNNLNFIYDLDYYILNLQSYQLQEEKNQKIILLMVNQLIYLKMNLKLPMVKNNQTMIILRLD